MSMNELSRVFDYQGNQVRTVVKDGEPWFVAKDVCDVLEIGDTRRAVERLDEDERSLTPLTDSLGRMQQTYIVNEPGLYSLILGSRKPEAKAFKRWITHEVIPAIRKHGMYATDEVIDKILADPDYGIQLLTKYKEERQKRIEAERTNNILMHVNKTYTATEIAKELGFKSAKAFNKDLERKKIQFKQNGTWVLFSNYADKGYVEIKQEVLDNGRVIYHRRWTQLGREFLLKLYGEGDHCK
jgi:anti-repressor protein